MENRLKMCRNRSWLWFSIVVLLTVFIPSAASAGGALFYGFNPLGGVTGGRLYLMGYDNDTVVQVEDLDNGLSWGPFTMGRGTLRIISLGADVHFKVRSYNHPVFAVLGGGLNFLQHENSGSYFVSTTDPWKRVGREFFFYSPVGDIDRDETDYLLVAYENSSLVRIMDESGNVKFSSPMAAEEFILVTEYIGFHDITWIDSQDGDIAVLATAVDGFDVNPAADGEDLGRYFLCGVKRLNANGGDIAVFAHENLQVSIRDLADDNWEVQNVAVNRGEFYFINNLGVSPGYRPYRIETTGDAVVWCGDTQGGTTIGYMGDDVAQQTGDGGKHFYIHSQQHGAQLFCQYDNTAVEITDLNDGSSSTTMVMGADGFYDLPDINTRYEILTDKPCLVQTGGGDSFDNYQTQLKPLPYEDEDNDTILDYTEGALESPPTDSDNDGTPDFQDLDSDDDGIYDRDEAGDDDPLTDPADTDTDGTPDYLDDDSDADGIPDSHEAGDADVATPPVDTDSDGIPDFLDDDSDADGKSDLEEGTGDDDADGIENYIDADDNDGPNGDLDHDGVTNGDENANGMNPNDPDSDHDGISDLQEWDSFCFIPPCDADNDGTIDALDDDSDDDGIPDSVEAGDAVLATDPVDSDGDGVADFRDPDSDDDGIPDVTEGALSHDADPTPDYLDLDSDNDGKLDETEGIGDVDGDGIPNYIDADDTDGPTGDRDGDGLTNNEETNVLGTNPDSADTDMDNISDRDEVYACSPYPCNTDGEDQIDALDFDSDNDGIPDVAEAGDAVLDSPAVDSDLDGTPDYRDPDSDADGIPDAVEGLDNHDGDPDPDYLDTDSDNDGVSDAVEGVGDTDGDGIPNYIDSNDNDGPDGDLDHDGLTNAEEAILNTDPNNPDSDGDFIPDVVEVNACTPYPCNTDGQDQIDALDTDSDNDGIGDVIESGDTSLDSPPIDTDLDSTPDYRDDDSDNDSIPDSTEGIGNPDADAYPNYRDTDSENDGKPDLLEGTGDDDGDGLPNYLDSNDNDGPLGDLDNDGVSNGDEHLYHTDPTNPDSDNDTIRDDHEVYGCAVVPCDTDDDGTIDALDDDSDADGIPDELEVTDTSLATPPTDRDQDGIPNFRDKDSDYDGIEDGIEGWEDVDTDGTPNFLDVDSDGDGARDVVEGTGDIDGDGIPNFLDFNDEDGPLGDLDHDGLTNEEESLYNTNPFDPDSDGDHLRDDYEVLGCDYGPCNTDGEDQIDALDSDSDNDGIPDAAESGWLGGEPGTGRNSDNDAIPDFRDSDSDNDNIPDTTEALGLEGQSTVCPTCFPDADGDGLPNYIDPDSDDDGILDIIEDDGSGGTDDDGDNIPSYLDADDDNGPWGDRDHDGLTNQEETIIGTDPDNRDSDGDNIDDLTEVGVNHATPLNSDFDGLIDARDPDSDNDGVADIDEAGDTDLNTPPRDADNDGQPDYRDTDSDADGIPDSVEEAGHGSLPDPADADEDGIPNRIDTDSDGDGKTDKVEGTGDADGDTIPDYLDKDDGVGDECHEGDTIECGSDVGQCEKGYRICVNRHWSPDCIDEVGPQGEVCDNVDNDCDYLVDEDVTRSCGTNTGECREGVEHCIYGEWIGDCVGEIAAVDEVCDGVDNDCDGVTDEGCSCEDGQVQFCGSDTGECERGISECVNGQWGDCEGGVLSAPEVCDNKDNDCDGAVDEDVTRNCGSDVGICEFGAQTCSRGTWSECVGGLTARQEQCNDLDDDCDGFTDEDIAIPCGTDEGECVAGVRYCDNGVLGVCTGEVPPVDELCDGRDNDCDGEIDETCDCMPDDTQPCGSDTGVCEFGIQTCSPQGAWGECLGQTLPSMEICDNLDNDCDGGIDENLRLPCGLDTGECRIGYRQCADGVWGACVGATWPRDETCDNLDNDCDGEIDENLREDCGSDEGVCKRGYRQCSGGSYGACLDEIVPVDEICDTLDNDCDGQVDEGCDCIDDDTQVCGTDTGECRTGIQTCVNGRWGQCTGQIVAQEEICDNKDNDCDGETDDGLTRLCGVSEGECRKGLQICQTGAWSQCQGATYPVAETCDGKDNDCDGSIDEELVQVCGTDVGECVAGHQLCFNGSWGLCIDETPPATVELCDGLDNNCNNETDENCPCVSGETQACGSAVGQCRQGTQVCDDQGFWGPCEGGRTAQPEICDGRDNDCDGETDETLYRACGSDTGACQSGYQTCSDGNWSPCTGTIGPATEICDNTDNDCDGLTDEDLQQPCGSDTGECSPGYQICAAGVWGQCFDDVPPTGEICDNRDNDCDGYIDEELDRACGTDLGECVAGMESCIGGQWSSCTGSVVAVNEICSDGKDNDCDGLFDEDCLCEDGATQSCGTDEGECVAGTQTCIGNRWGLCVGAIGPGTEVCDTFDNDCDGFVDEDLKKPCGNNIGQCRQGVSTCVSGEWGICEGEVASIPEICDGLDNDCDGQTDEGVTRSCGTDTGICQSGIQTCADGAWGVCVGEVAPANTELCDGLDNNCNGDIDEGCPCVSGTAQNCGSDVGLCISGTQNCVAGVWSSCTGSVEPQPEICDGEDNDCDGSVDEFLTKNCGSGEGVCRQGVQLCNNGLWSECMGQVNPGVEVCNGLDDDCDGQTDEDLGRVCGTDTGECVAGVQTCVSGVWGTCEGEHEPQPEICDGLDNNCDGVYDEGCSCSDDDTQSCGSGTGDCEPGQQTCIAGAWGQCLDETGPREETCDNHDNDCDGQIDEGLFRSCGSDVGECVAGIETCTQGEWSQCFGEVAPADEICDGKDNNCDGFVDEDLPNCNPDGDVDDEWETDVEEEAESDGDEEIIDEIEIEFVEFDEPEAETEATDGDAPDRPDVEFIEFTDEDREENAETDEEMADAIDIPGVDNENSDTGLGIAGGGCQCDATGSGSRPEESVFFFGMMLALWFILRKTTRRRNASDAVDR